jgi:hypothetical protein
VSASTGPIQVRIGPRVSAVQVVALTIVLIIGLLAGLVVGRARVQGAPTTRPGHWSVQEYGPQSHMGQMHRDRPHGKD